MKEVQASEKQPFLARAKKKIMGRIYDAAFNFLSPRFEKLTNAIEPYYPDNYAEIMRKAHTDGYLLMFIANHQTHADGFPMAKVTSDAKKIIHEEDTVEKFHGFKITVATSVKGGRQSEYITSAFDKISPWISRFSLFPKLYARKGTIDKGTNFDVLKEVLASNSEGYGIAALPEGTVAGGRTTNGLQNGIQEIGEQNLATVIKMLDRPGKPDRGGKERKVLYIPASFNGITLVYHPDKKHPSIKELLRLLAPVTLARKLSVTIQEPITSAQLRQLAVSSNVSENDYPRFAARYIYGQIASALTPQAQGDYGRKALGFKHQVERNSA